MINESKSKEQHLDELIKLRKKINGFETRESRLNHTIQKQKRLIEQFNKKDNKKKKLAEMERRYEFIANNAKEFMTLINRDYIYEAVNESYCKAHNKKREDVIGNTVADNWGEKIFNTILKGYLDKCFTGSEVRYQKWFNFPGLGKRYFDVAYYPYRNKEGIITHAVVVTHDITERKQAEDELRRHRDHLEEMVKERTAKLEKTNKQLKIEILERKRVEKERERLITKLQEALDHVKTLKGLVPICASCKNVRNDDGFWQQVEAYVSEHTEAKFSHSICPDCMKKLYPAEYERLKKKGKIDGIPT